MPDSTESGAERPALRCGAGATRLGRIHRGEADFRAAQFQPRHPRSSASRPCAQEKGQNDDRVFHDNVAQAVVLHHEVPESGIRLMLSHRIHLRELRNHLDSTDDGLPDVTDKTSKRRSRGFGPQDPHPIVIRRRARTTRA